MARSVLLYLSLFLSFLSPLALASDEIIGKEIIINKMVSSEMASKDKVPLRVLPLGASITWGVNSATGNGYRKPLHDKLESNGWEVDMVGSQKHGTMKDNVRYTPVAYPYRTMSANQPNQDVEAHSGDIVDKVKAAAHKSLKYEPNVVLINAGTNDCLKNISIPHTGARMRSLINDILKDDDSRNATVVLSTLIPSHNKDIVANLPKVNRQYRDLVKSMRKEGARIVLADMNPEGEGGDDRLSWPKDYIGKGKEKADDTHPNDGGYKKMATVWYKAIEEAWKDDLIQE